MSAHHYSKPLRTQATKLAFLYYMQERNIPERPGRTLNVGFDANLPLVEGFDVKYVYWVTLQHKGATAGNHYHHQKAEIFCPVKGDMVVMLKNPQTQESESVVLSARDHTRLLVRTGIAHKVVSQSDEAILLVLASCTSAEEDEVYFSVD